MWGEADETEPETEDVTGDDGERADIGPAGRRRKSLSAPKPPAPVSEQEQRRAHRLIEQLTEIIASDDFLSRRQPAYLAVDLQIMSVMLQEGLRQHWIEEADFLEVTHHIWAALFFTSGRDPAAGWLEVRHREAEDPGEFRSSLSSPQLAAALAAWAMSVPEAMRSFDEARFALACVLAVARLPWLWYGRAHVGATAIELSRVLAVTRAAEPRGGTRWEDSDARWRALIATGDALRHLEGLLAGQLPQDIREQAEWELVEPGDLLWQGRGVGFCVATSRCRRGQDCTALKLQGETEESTFVGRAVNPVMALLSVVVIPATKEFSQRHRARMREFINALERGFVSGRPERSFASVANVRPEPLS